MAQSRLEKVSTIYHRINSLLRGGAKKQEDTPLWLAIYEAFPPKYEPKFERKLPSKPVRPIFYQEDLMRAKFHKNQSSLPATNLKKENIKTVTQNFLSTYKTIQKEENLPADEAYERAILQYKSEKETERMELWKVNNESSNSPA